MCAASGAGALRARTASGRPPSDSNALTASTKPNARRRTSRTVYGGAVTAGKPVATFVIIGLCALVYVLQWIVPNDGIYQQLAYAPALTG